MSEPTERLDARDSTDGASEPGVATHRPWLRIMTLIVLAAFVLATLVGSLLL
ncbi:hypothetical protein ACR9E3_21605 [Actinomycetospora sp. C-140]